MSTIAHDGSNRWPFDIAALRRGDVVSADVIEAAVGLKRTDAEYHFEHLRIRDMVVERFEEMGDEGVIVTMRDGGLQVLTDEEAAGYVQARARKAKKDFAWSVYKGSQIDRDKLLDETREKLDRWQHVQAFRLQQLRRMPPPALTNEGDA